MASATTRRPFSSSNSERSFDVFLSFTGEDTRYTFANYLYQALIHNGIRTFRDDENLPRGGELGPELMKAIEGSRISIVVFSENYAYSKWCLEELAKIMECKKERKQKVIPIFYHVDPSKHVRKQKGIYGEAFADHERDADADADEEKKKRITKWRTALWEAGRITGYHVVKNKYELATIEEIVNEIRKFIPKPFDVDGKIVGINKKLKAIKLLTNIQSNDVHMVGIYGIGGIGKTTITKILYNDILDQYEGGCFLENVRENSKDDHGLLQLQQKLLKDIPKEKILEVHGIGEGIHMIKRFLLLRKVLIVLDDVDHLKQLKFLVGSCEWFGLGSRIIITTRGVRCLNELGVSASYELKGLQMKKAIELFSWNAFHRSFPADGYVDLTKDIVDYTKGHPLALRVLGSSLLERKVNEWKSTLQMLRRNLPMDIKKVLEISYIGLDDTWKELFLDIACFFKNHEKTHIIRILESCHPGVELGISVLNEKCLITLDHGIIGMHDLLQEMGHQIASQDCPQQPGKWRRLWENEDIDNVFTTNTGTEAIEGIFLNISRSKEIPFTTEAFKVMKRLRFLKVYYNDHYPSFEDVRLLKDYDDDHYPSFKEVRLLKDYDDDHYPRLKDLEFPSHELRYLHWDKYSLKSLSSNFNGKKLVELSLRFSNVKQLWKSSKILDKLKIIDLSNSKKLIEMPNFSNMPNLEILDLTDCTSLRKLHSSIEVLKKLTLLNLSGCRKLRNIPSSIDALESLEVFFLNNCRKLDKFPEIRGNIGRLSKFHLDSSGIKELPSSFKYLTSLEDFSLSSCSNLEKFPEIFGNMRHLRKLCLNSSGVKELPRSIGDLESLEILDLSFCSNFEIFPEMQGTIMKSLKELRLMRTPIKELPSSFGCLDSLEQLNLRGCRNFDKLPEIQMNKGNLLELDLDKTAIEELPSSIGHLRRLRILNLRSCKNLRSLPSSICKLKSLNRLSLKCCSNLEAFPEIMEVMECLQSLDLCETAIKELPSSIENLIDLRHLELMNCENLVTLPYTIGNLSCLRSLKLMNCENLTTLPESIGNLTCLDSLEVMNCKNLMTLPNGISNLTHFESLNLMNCENLMTLPNSIGNLTRLESLELIYCENLVTLPDSIGNLTCLKYLGLKNCKSLVTLPNSISNLTCLRSLRVCNCSKLQKFPNNLRRLKCCLDVLDLSGCNLAEGEIPGDIWSSYSLVELNLSQNDFRVIPADIIQLSKLRKLVMNDCLMLEEIPELPSSLRRIEARDCPFLEASLSNPLSRLWSPQIKYSKSEIVLNPSVQREIQLHTGVVFLGINRIPEWVNHQNKGCEVTIDLPLNVYQDNDLLGFAVFFHLPQNMGRDLIFTDCKLRISHGDEYEVTDDFTINWRKSDSQLWVGHFPRISISGNHRSDQWITFNVSFHHCNYFGSVDIGLENSCGVHLIYAEDDHQQKERHCLGLLRENENTNSNAEIGGRCLELWIDSEIQNWEGMISIFDYVKFFFISFGIFLIFYELLFVLL